MGDEATGPRRARLALRALSGAPEPGGRPRKKGLARHLDGWQPALVAVFLAASAAVLAVPRAVEPAELPAPASDPRVLEHIARVDAQLADEAVRSPLDHDVRELGSAVRAFGAAEAEGDDDEAARQHQLAEKASFRAVDVGLDPVLQLRAYQQRVFLRELRRWEATGTVTVELEELGGGLLRMLRQNHWADESPTERRVAMPEPALIALFKKRWGELTNLRMPPFEIALDETRVLFAFFLAHPIPVALSVPEGSSADAIAARRTLEHTYQLKKVDELTKVDPTYPREFARGIVLYQLGRYGPAVQAFRRHLEAAPDGPFTLRAQNYLRAALGRERDEPL